MGREAKYLSRLKISKICDPPFKTITFHVLYPQLLDKSGRENTGCEGTTEDSSELRIKSSNTHVLELEARGQNGIRGASKADCQACVAQRLDLNLLLRAPFDLD